jgi:hypothetical protein
MEKHIQDSISMMMMSIDFNEFFLGRSEKWHKNGAHCYQTEFEIDVDNDNWIA